jgi:hypothetical protein
VSRSLAIEDVEEEIQKEEVVPRRGIAESPFDIFSPFLLTRVVLQVER